MALRTRNITFEGACFALRLMERGTLHLKRAKRLENRGLSNRGEMTYGGSDGLPSALVAREWQS